mmetsp:Transcript_7145/g.15716  ORF Transcript_7145/g.15716 Transcript_7145/m.15716 type:complete len:400 (+) Transcript_7145:1303-2502(+)
MQGAIHEPLVEEVQLRQGDENIDDLARAHLVQAEGSLVSDLLERSLLSDLHLRQASGQIGQLVTARNSGQWDHQAHRQSDEVGSTILGHCGVGRDEHDQASEGKQVQASRQGDGSGLEQGDGRLPNPRIQLGQLAEGPMKRSQFKWLEVSDAQLGQACHLGQELKIDNFERREGPDDVAERLALGLQAPVLLQLAARGLQQQPERRVLKQVLCWGLRAARGELRQAVEGRGDVDQVHLLGVHADRGHEVVEVPALGGADDLAVDVGVRLASRNETSTAAGVAVGVDGVAADAAAQVDLGAVAAAAAAAAAGDGHSRHVHVVVDVVTIVVGRGEESARSDDTARGGRGRSEPIAVVLSPVVGVASGPRALVLVEHVGRHDDVLALLLLLAGGGICDQGRL